MKTSTGVKTLVLALFAVAVMALTVGVAQADTIVWNFDNPTGIVSSPHTYLDTGGNFAITASGFNTTNLAPASGTWTLAGVTSNDLYGKFTLGDPSETGLGLAGKSSFEIQPMTLIQLDLIDLINKGLTDEKLIISSVQSGEGFAVFAGSDAAANGAEGTLVGSGTGLPDVQTLTFSGSIANRYQWITATSGDVLIKNGLSATTTSVPEPSTLLLFGLGLAGLAGIRRKFKK